jgi:hypothetical protein
VLCQRRLGNQAIHIIAFGTVTFLLRIDTTPCPL